MTHTTLAPARATHPLEMSSMSGSVSPGGSPSRSRFRRHASFLISSMASKLRRSRASWSSLY